MKMRNLITILGLATCFGSSAMADKIHYQYNRAELHVATGSTNPNSVSARLYGLLKDLPSGFNRAYGGKIITGSQITISASEIGDKTFYQIMFDAPEVSLEILPHSIFQFTLTGVSAAKLETALNGNNQSDISCRQDEKAGQTCRILMSED